MTITVAFAIDAAADSESDGLWPVGAAGVALITLAGSLICGQIGTWFRDRRQRVGSP